MSDGTVKCIEDEIPFDVPESWAWARLGFLAFYKKGPFGSSITKAMFVPDSAETIKVYEQKNAICKDETLGTYYITPEKFLELKGFEVFPDDIIVSCAGTIGESFVMPSTMRQGVINQALMRIMLYDKNIIDFYLVYFDFVLKSESNDKGKGTAMKNIPPFDVLKQFLMPIPPLPEQMRILQVINQLTACISCIDDTKHEITCLMTQAKSKILDLAIRGKLVPQNPADESASVLLERIRAEKEQLIKAGKIKRDNNESYIFRGDDKSYYEKVGDSVKNIDAEIPFDMPVSWGFVRLDTAMPYEQPQPYIVNSTEYDVSYPTPVLTAGKSFIIGYTNETDGIKTDLPAVIFDDFTTDSKYVDFPFKVKSSAMKILTADSSFADIKFYYYVMQQIECNHSTHKRYWISDFSKKIALLYI